jgi:hypothetical protein
MPTTCTCSTLLQHQRWKHVLLELGSSTHHGVIAAGGFPRRQLPCRQTPKPKWQRPTSSGKTSCSSYRQLQKRAINLQITRQDSVWALNFHKLPFGKSLSLGKDNAAGQCISSVPRLFHNTPVQKTASKKEGDHFFVFATSLIPNKSNEF